jgi:hypothetical protein
MKRNAKGLIYADAASTSLGSHHVTSSGGLEGESIDISHCPKNN